MKMSIFEMYSNGGAYNVTTNAKKRQTTLNDNE